VKIFYYCHSGVHASVVTAGIHMGRLPRDHASTEEILALPHFDDRQGYPAGTPFYLGEDEKGNKVYTFAVANEKFLAPKTVRCFMDLFGLPQDQVRLVDALKYTDAALKWGGYLSVDIGLKFLGRPMLLASIKKSYPNYVQQVQRLKQELGYLN